MYNVSLSVNIFSHCKMVIKNKEVLKEYVIPQWRDVVINVIKTAAFKNKSVETPRNEFC